MKSIQSMMSATTTVVRDGQTTQIPTEDVVPGDIVVLSLGERVPADLRIVSVHGLRVDQSILTGESEPVALRTKQTSDNYLESKNITFCGASVVEGSGVGLIVATGSQTMMGSIALKYALSIVCLQHSHTNASSTNPLCPNKTEPRKPKPKLPTSLAKFVA